MEEKTKINGSQEPESMVSGETNTEEQSVSVVSVDYKDVKIHTPSNADSDENLISSQFETASKTEKARFSFNVKTWLKNLRTKFSSTYTKRNSIVNAVLSLFWIATIVVSLMVLVMSLTVLVRDFKDGWSFATCGVFYPLFCIYYMCRFVIANKKNSIFPAFMGSTLVWYVILIFYVLVTTPNSAFLDNEGNESPDSWIISFVLPFILSVIINAFLFWFVYLIMKIRKYGASAWTLLDVSRAKRSKFEKISIIIFSLIWLLPVGAFAYYDYVAKHPVDKYPSHNNAKIGDYYYSDGTVSSEVLPDKKAVGIVFSLEVSEKDRIMGYNHGQIVSLSDISPNKMQWDSYNLKDYEKYPNYNWTNRMDALNDIDGLMYTNCEDFTCLQINWDSMKFMEDEIEGASDWYVPTAGQWAKILENIGGVKVDGMLRFNPDTASRNLEKININPEHWYWTITEFDAENAWSIRIKNGEFGSRSNKQNGAYVRPVASF